jgi:hypothetical protein
MVTQNTHNQIKPHQYPQITQTEKTKGYRHFMDIYGGISSVPEPEKPNPTPQQKTETHENTPV